MERLTIRTLYGAKFKGLPPYANRPDKNILLSEAAERLAAYEDTGKTPEQLAEWAKAEQEGRLVVLPCKDGDTVKANVLRPYNGNTLTIHGEVVDIETVIRVRYNQDRYIDFLIEDFGKTVFLTPEAAKEAMRKNK